jgi:predicted acyl esterase
VISDETARCGSQRLLDVAPELERTLMHGDTHSPLFERAQIKRETIWVAMRDGVRLATDLHLPPKLPAPVIALRTPYGRAADKFANVFPVLACHGYVVVAQDCRGTGDSEPDCWDYYVREAEDGYDFVDWVLRQEWFDGFLAACGGSYAGQTQWCMATHPAMSTIVPEVSGLGIAVNTVHLHMFCNAYARSVGKGTDKLPVPLPQLERAMVEETLATGYFNEPLHRQLPGALLADYPELLSLQPAEAKRWLWERYCAFSCAQRAEFIKKVSGTDNVTVLEVEALPAIFGQQISHDAHTIPHARPSELCRLLHAPALMITGWYDWGLNDALATWELFRREARESVRSRSRLLVAPSAHSMPGYHEGVENHPELGRNYRTENNVGVLLRWYAAVRSGTTETWPTVTYYLMGANEWRATSDWPPPEASRVPLYLGADGALSTQAPQQPSKPDRYLYDPRDPTPTVGGSILSYVYRPGSVDVSAAQNRADVVTYTTARIERALDVVGPLRLILYASSTALDTDFSARLSDVFPDGRVIQLQSGMLRARYRNVSREPELLEPGRIYRLEIDLWATANRFEVDHRLRLDIASADFPRFDRNSNRGGEPGPPLPAVQTIYHDAEHPSHLIVSVLDPAAVP